MKKMYYLVLMAVTLGSTHALAVDKGGFFIEPMLTYEKSDNEIDFPDPIGNSDGESRGLGVALRAGFHVFESVWVGLDGRYAKIDFSDDETDFESDANSYNYGPVIGLQLPTPVSLRVWAGYVMGGSLDPEEDNDIDVKFKDLKGTRVGAGLMLGTVSLNMEVQDLTYDEVELEEVGPFDSDTSFDSVDLKTNAYVFSVSFPYAL